MYISPADWVHAPSRRRRRPGCGARVPRDPAGASSTLSLAPSSHPLHRQSFPKRRKGLLVFRNDTACILRASHRSTGPAALLGPATRLGLPSTETARPAHRASTPTVPPGKATRRRRSAQREQQESSSFLSAPETAPGERKVAPQRPAEFCQQAVVVLDRSSSRAHTPTIKESLSPPMTTDRSDFSS
ncbi:hypothetical protein CPLU01_06588 [Colletotrichum plurivorum]|uniref:Uncharacterized protein n=1 Tax=Colletotrichum plurivorum TaxID=2175906 RepID=A0A8H6KI51_9PEZI|nr:hypothetical protein CPLU01_06588 [Colletotrichum plurivorum]